MTGRRDDFAPGTVWQLRHDVTPPGRRRPVPAGSRVLVVADRGGHVTADVLGARGNAIARLDLAYTHLEYIGPLTLIARAAKTARRGGIPKQETET